MKTLNLILAFLLVVAFAFNINAQQIPNGGFENWLTKVINDPDGFSTSNTMVSSDEGNVTKVTDAYHGSFAAKLETVLSGNETVNGMLIIGNLSDQGISGGLPYSGTPDSISGYVKYDVQPGDEAYFIVAFKKDGNLMGQPLITTFTGSQADYMRFSMPTYLSELNPPDTLVAVITSSNMDPPQIVGSTLTIDSVSFINSPEEFPNGDFENWTEINTGENPESWSSFNNFYAYGIPEMSFKTTDAHLGDYALRIITLTAIVNPPFGTGALDTLSGYVFLGEPNMDNSGIPYTDLPISMEAYVKGTIVAGSEAYIMASISKWNTTNQERDEIASAMYHTANSITDYTQITIPFNYNSPDIPDTLEIRIMAGNVGPGGVIMPGNEFFVDDISFTLPVAINDINMDKSSISVFPNPTYDKITVSSLEKVNTIEIYNVLGEKVYTANYFKQQTTTEIDLTPFQRGIYFVKIYNGKKFYLEKIIKLQ